MSGTFPALFSTKVLLRLSPAGKPLSVAAKLVQVQMQTAPTHLSLASVIQGSWMAYPERIVVDQWTIGTRQPSNNGVNSDTGGARSVARQRSVWVTFGEGSGTEPGAGWRCECDGAEGIWETLIVHGWSVLLY